MSEDIWVEETDEYDGSLFFCKDISDEHITLQDVPDKLNELEKYKKAYFVLKEANEFYKNISNLDRPAYMRQGEMVRNLKQAAYKDGGAIANEAAKKAEEIINAHN